MEGMLQMMSGMEKERMRRSHGHFPPAPKTEAQQMDEIFVRMLSEMEKLKAVAHYRFYRSELENVQLRWSARLEDRVVNRKG